MLAPIAWWIIGAGAAAVATVVVVDHVRSPGKGPTLDDFLDVGKILFVVALSTATLLFASDNRGGNDPDETVEDILKRRIGSIRQAPLDPGSPSWNDILKVTWAEVVRRAKENWPGYKTIYKLLINGRFRKKKK